MWKLAAVTRAISPASMPWSSASVATTRAPYRGKRNEPAYVARVVATLAELHGIEAGEMARVTAANFHTLFRP